MLMAARFFAALFIPLFRTVVQFCLWFATLVIKGASGTYILVCLTEYQPVKFVKDVCNEHPPDDIYKYPLCHYKKSIVMLYMANAIIHAKSVL